LNEERSISECIASARSADEIVVVDSGSTDRTREIAEAAGARVVERSMTDFAEQRNFASGLAKFDWVMHLDADERLTPQLLEEIRRVISTPSAKVYRVPRLTYMFGALVRHGGWYPQYHERLHQRDYRRWSRSVHETVMADGSVGTLVEPLVHNSHPDIHAFIRKLDLYTTMEASLASRSRLRLSLGAIFEPGPYFVYKYIAQQGFRDGWRGLAAALLMACYRCVGYLKALELRSRP
jgi:glycosyltransferase involved in cell wall biosynthesis